jgi:hypothetical protein
MGLLNKLFGIKDKSKNPIASKKQLGSIKINGNKIICINNENDYNNFEIIIDKIEYIYVSNSVYHSVSLFIYDGHQHYLSIDFDGFDTVYNYLSEKLNFKEAYFIKTIDKKMLTQKEVYRKKRNANFQILTNQNHEDYHLGFEILSPKPEFICWDLSFEALEKNENLKIVVSDYDQKMFVFKFPVRIGNIILEKLMFFDTSFRKDIPVLRFNSDCYSDNSSDESILNLRQILSTNLKECEPFWERNDSKNYNFNASGINFSMYYWYDSDYAYNSGFTSFTIENHRDFPNLLINLEYENKISVDKFIVFEEDFSNIGNYKTNPNVKRIPEKIIDLFSNKSGIWIDKINNKIGFADKKQSQIFEIESIKNIAIQNVAPAKGGGGCYLELHFNDDKSSFSIFEGNYKELDIHTIKIQELTDKTVIFNAEYNDC